MSDTVRVAATQFATGTDVDENLDTCLRVIDQAAAQGAQIIVLPEFANHTCWYDDADGCWAVSVDLDGPFVAALSAAAAAANAHVQVNVTVRRGAADDADRHVTGTNLFFGPDGTLLATHDKQVLMGNENNFLRAGQVEGPVVDTEHGPVGLYCCMEGVIYEPPRVLALRGAHLLLNSLNSFALDEAALHIPVRAAENRVWVAAANKVGPIVPPEALAVAAARLKVPVEALHGAGEAQIIAPGGVVVAKAPTTGEAVVVADIDLDLATDKRRPDGTDVLAGRRPDLCGPIVDDPGDGVDLPPAAEVVDAAVVQPDAEHVLEDVVAVVRSLADEGVSLIVLPELVTEAGGVTLQPADAAGRGEALLDALVAAAGSSLVVTSVVEAADDGWAHVGVAVTGGGVVLRQVQLHPCARHPWATARGAAVETFTEAWGRVAVIVGDDSLFPETPRLAALAGCQVLAVPATLGEAWDAEIGLVERAAENRVCLVAAARPSELGTSLIVTLPAGFTLWAERDRPFDGTINTPDVVRAPLEPGVTQATIHPARAANKSISAHTDLVNGRPWRSIGALAETPDAFGGVA